MNDYKRNFRQLVCNDGATVSIQASRTHYCAPRKDMGPYTHVEAGFPSVVPPRSWHKYAENGDYTGTVYGYMPVELVDDFIKAHKGINWGATL